ncbi:rRNA-processing protein efg1 [Collariella sp. IMI 366227]|nr:rRNA-processing protein efg1 [Collariella sp. IMI 366227]
MGGKRAHPDGESVNGFKEDESRKRLRTNRPFIRAKQANVDIDSMAAIKKRARAIERLLARENLKLPANKQKDLERELAAHKQRIEDSRNKKERSNMIQKYHMVRFFERKKAMRFAKQLEKKVAQATEPEEIIQLKADLHVAQVDTDYAIYFPFMETYVSLYAGATSGDKDEKEEKGAAARYLRTPRPPMWSVIEKTREEGKHALERLQNRRSPKSSTAEGSEQTMEDHAGKKSSTRKDKKRAQQQEHNGSARSRPGRREEEVAGRDEDENDSDGGFFE